MNFIDYQIATRKTAKYPEAEEGSFGAVNYTLLGLANEAGEALGKWKKVIRDEGGLLTTEKREALLDELGDVLWYIARTCDELGEPMTEVARNNVSKLESRLERGVIGGSGDTR